MAYWNSGRKPYSKVKNIKSGLFRISEVRFFIHSGNKLPKRLKFTDHHLWMLVDFAFVRFNFSVIRNGNLAINF